MKPVKFDGCNSEYGAPKGLASSQVLTIPAYQGEIHGGSCDGLKQVVVGYELTEEEIQNLIDGKILYVSMLTGLMPHYLSFDFHSATHPA